MGDSKKSKKSFIFVFTLFIARISTFIRDILISAIFGSNIISDMFLISFRIPNFFKLFLSEGSINLAFIPTYTQKSFKNHNSGVHYANKILFVIFSLLFALTIYIEIFTESFLTTITSVNISSFRNGEYFDILMTLLRISFLYVILYSFASFLNSILCANDRFNYSFIGQIFLNIIMIFILLYYRNIDLINSAYLLCISMPISAFVYFYVVAQCVKKHGIFSMRVVLNRIFKMNLRSKIHKISRYLTMISYKNILQIVSIYFRAFFSKTTLSFLYKFLFAMLWVGISQINSFIDLAFASRLTAGIMSCIYYADRISRFPITLISIPLSLLFLPKLSKAIAAKNKDLDSIKAILVERVLLLCIPVTIVLILFANEIIHGLFDILPKKLFNIDSNITVSICNIADILKIFALGIPSYILFKIFSMICFTYDQQKYLLYGGSISILFNIVINYMLIEKYQFYGIALATVISSWSGVIYMGYIMNVKKLSNIFDNINHIVYTILSSIATIVFIVKCKKQYLYNADIWIYNISICILSMCLYYIIYISLKYVYNMRLR